MPTGLGLAENDTILPVVPMFHANAWGLQHAAVMVGAKLVMPGPNLQPKALADMMEREKVTLTAGVPTICAALLPELKVQNQRLNFPLNLCTGAREKD